MSASLVKNGGLCQYRAARHFRSALHAACVRACCFHSEKKNSTGEGAIDALSPPLSRRAIVGRLAPDLCYSSTDDISINQLGNKVSPLSRSTGSNHRTEPRFPACLAFKTARMLVHGTIGSLLFEFN